MKGLGRLSISLALLGLFVGCSSEQVGEVVDALTKIPYVDRSESEIESWFKVNNRVVIDDETMGVIGVTNGDPIVELFEFYMVNEKSYANVLCITQYNTLPGEPQPAKYAALVEIKVLDNPNLFEAGEIEPVSCNDRDPPALRYMTANLAFGRPMSVIEQNFRDAVNDWLKKDIVATLKSNTNIDGLEGFSNPVPRNPAKKRGVKYAVIKDTGPPSILSISFIAE